MVEWPFVAAVERHNNNSEVVIHAAVRRLRNEKSFRDEGAILLLSDRRAMVRIDKYYN